MDACAIDEVIRDRGVVHIRYCNTVSHGLCFCAMLGAAGLVVGHGATAAEAVADLCRLLGVKDEGEQVVE